MEASGNQQHANHAAYNPPFSAELSMSLLGLRLAKSQKSASIRVHPSTVLSATVLTTAEALAQADPRFILHFKQKFCRKETQGTHREVFILFVFLCSLCSLAANSSLVAAASLSLTTNHWPLFPLAFPSNRGNMGFVWRLERVLKIDLEWDGERGGVDGEASPQRGQRLYSSDPTRAHIREKSVTEEQRLVAP
jgi:hypothetical protein